MAKKATLARIMQHENMIFESRDGISIGVMWNNITGKNFEKDDAGHRKYLLQLKMEAGLPAGYIQYFSDFSKDKCEEFLVPSSDQLDVYKIEQVNSKQSIMFGGAVKFEDLFVGTDTKTGKYIRGVDGKHIPTEKCQSVIDNWHCTKWGHTSYFEFYPRENGITDVYIKADQIIASSLFACIYTNTIPEPAPEQDEEETLAISGSETIVMAKMNAMDVFKKCTIDGNVIRLPKDDLGKELYTDVKTILEKNGGSWKGGKIAGFEFKFDPTSIFDKLQSGEKVNNKKKFQFFGTQPELADYIVKLAEINNRHELLEPSAGQGAIVEAVHRMYGKGRQVHVFELMEENQEVLKKLSRVSFLGTDFLSANLPEKFDRIIANPPFTNNQDIDHVQKMYECLKPGGRLVSIMSVSWKNGKQKKQEEFKEWLRKVNAKTADVPAGAFKKSGTSVATVIVIINKK